MISKTKVNKPIDHSFKPDSAGLKGGFWRTAESGRKRQEAAGTRRKLPSYSFLL
jgi:hypothetical protein